MKPPLVLVADTPSSLKTMKPHVGYAAANGYQRIAIDIDGLPQFDVADVRELICLLRIARDRGASLALRVATPERLRTLRDMGLDRVFAIVA